MSSYLDNTQLEMVKRQLASITPCLSPHQIYALADLLFEAAREREPDGTTGHPHVDVRV